MKKIKLASTVLTITLVMGLYGCGEERVNNGNNKVSESKVSTTVKGDKKDGKVRASSIEANSSKALKQISKEQGEIKKNDCEDKFKNENGDCEVPNQPHPKKEIK